MGVVRSAPAGSRDGSAAFISRLLVNDPGWGCSGEDRARELVRAELERQELAARAFVKLNGWSVMGRVACMNVSPYRCAKSWEELGKLVPHIAAGRGQKEARLAAIARLVEFRQKHREAKARWVAGDRSVVFPAGTYWMRVHHGARVAAFE